VYAWDSPPLGGRELKFVIPVGDFQGNSSLDQVDRNSHQNFASVACVDNSKSLIINSNRTRTEATRDGCLSPQFNTFRAVNNAEPASRKGEQIVCWNCPLRSIDDRVVEEQIIFGADDASPIPGESWLLRDHESFNAAGIHVPDRSCTGDRFFPLHLYGERLNGRARRIGWEAGIRTPISRSRVLMEDWC